MLHFSKKNKIKQNTGSQIYIKKPICATYTHTYTGDNVTALSAAYISDAKFIEKEYHT